MKRIALPDTHAKSKRPIWALVFTLLLLAPLPGSIARAQTARISEAKRSIRTYPFYEPDPTPMLVADERLWPYFGFQSYTDQAESREWTVVTLENEFVAVYVLPEVGGKVWGAIEKKSGHEFIYRNEVLKFRDIALRGPWTSGGIEFNFGVIGHTPSTATPVDYLLRENPDGSVSCFVGATDLPSGTPWRVEIRVPAAGAYFETNVLWHNPTPLVQPYYNWMTAAAFARDDLVMTIPGDAYLHHSGDAEPWPVDDQGRRLSSYSANDFGPSKSYHVVGSFSDFFGGYYTADDYGFGHWAPYSDMPGQKLWIWSLSRSGGIWEDLLTDTDGQYVEFQAGRLFVQYGGGGDNPITQVGFEPYATDHWREIWYPVEGIGGLTAASDKGALSARVEGNLLQVGLNAFHQQDVTIEVNQHGRPVWKDSFDARPLQAVSASAVIDPDADVEIVVPELALRYISDPSKTPLDRPFGREAGIMAGRPENERLVFEGGQLEKAGRYSEAAGRFEAALENDIWDRQALAGLARIRYRQGRFVDGSKLAHRLLQLDAYDAEANFLAGMFYRALGSDTDAREAFGWAARSMAYRSAARTELAELALAAGEPLKSISEASTALDFNRFNLTALEVLAGAARTADRTRVWSEAVDRLLGLDPLNLYARLEKYLAASGPDQLADVRSVLRREFASEAMLDAGVSLFERGLERDARRVLELGDRVAPSQMQRLWLAWMNRSADSTASAFLLRRAADMSIGSPHRVASVPALSWAAATSDDWVWKYLLALDFWSMDRPKEAYTIMDSLGNQPDSAAFYLARASLGRRVNGFDEETDLRRAVELEPAEPAARRALIQYLQSHERWRDALDVVESGVAIYDGPANFDILAARSLVGLGRPDEALELLNHTNVLPSEGSAGGHVVYEEAHLQAGMQRYREGAFESAEAHFRQALAWPENLGAGKPFDPEERLPRYLLGLSLLRTGHTDDAGKEFRRVIAETRAGNAGPQLEQILAYEALEAMPGDTAESELSELMGRFADGDEALDIRGAWLFARASGATGRAEDIQRSHPELFSGRSIRLLLEALDLDL